MASRTANSIRNIMAGTAAQVVSFLLSFVSRTALIVGLGSYYLGLNSVLTSLIAMFSLAELGLGNAIVYSLYRPLATKDTAKVEAYLCLFKKVYRAIGLAVVILALAVLPFLPALVNTELTAETYAAYALFVANSAMSYLLFTYRTTLFQANQERYLVTCTELVYALSSALLQSIAFLVLHSFLLGVGALLVCQVARSMFVLCISKRRYGHIDYSSKRRLNSEDKRVLGRNVYAMALGKFSDTASASVPSVVISAVIGLVQSGLFSNYQIVSSAVAALMGQLCGSVTASVGNLNVEGDTDLKVDAFKKVSFVAFFGYTIGAACTFVGINPFIEAWVGSEYVLSDLCAFGVAFNLLTIGLCQSTVAFKDGCGIFYPGRFRPVASCMLTIAFCILFAHWFGIAGVIFAPAISRIATAMWYDSLLVHRYVFHMNPARHYLRTCLFALVSLTVLVLSWGLCSLLGASSWLLFIECVLVAAVVSVTMVMLVFFRYEPCRYCRELIVRMLTHRVS